MTNFDGDDGERMGLLKTCVLLLRAMLIPKVHLAIENLVLRQQLAVFKQPVKRPKLWPRDRVFWVWLSRLWAGLAFRAPHRQAGDGCPLAPPRISTLLVLEIENPETWSPADRTGGPGFDP